MRIREVLGLRKVLGLLASGVLLLALSAPATADWLVLQDGTQVETEGEWTVKGRLIVFKNADGALASLRASEVDLDASVQATEAAVREAEAAAEAAAAPPPEQPRRKPVLVLTDRDVGHVDPEEEGAGVEGEPQESQPLRVVTWEQEASTDGNGIIVSGVLRNDGAEVATRIELTVQVLDAEGTILGTQPAQLSANTLNTAELLNFRTHFPDLEGFDEARFEVASRSFRPIPPVSPPPASSADGESEATAEADSESQIIGD